MYKVLLYTHSLMFTIYLVHSLMFTIYLVHLLIKLILMVSKNKNYETYRAKTKVILEMIVPTLMVATGLGLLFQGPYLQSTWMYVKIGVMLLAVGIGVVGFKKQNIPMSFLCFGLLIYVLMLGYRKDITLAKNTEPVVVGKADDNASGVEKGKLVYQELNCRMCHGEDGALMLAGAINLQKSDKDDDYLKNNILNGKNSMPAYKGRISDEQLNDLVTYVKSMRK